MRPLPLPSPAALAIAAILLTAPAVRAQDVPGGADLPLISRYEGSRLAAFQDDGFTSVTWPGSYERAGMVWAKPMTIEGERQRRVYIAPAGRKALEVQRNYEAALLAAGAQKLLSCASGERCMTYGGGHEARSEYPGWLADGNMHAKLDIAFPAINGSGSEYHAIFKLARGGRTYFVTLISVDGANEGTGTVLDVISPKPMDTGKVGVASADAIGAGLKAEGRMAVYGIPFDTGKAEIRPDAKPQLAEMAKLLKSQPALKVFIVGHTDNQGTVDTNLPLSQHRADAIVAALVKDHAIAANRLQARGVANFAPVATNATDDGRARNRRVELVVQ